MGLLNYLFGFGAVMSGVLFILLFLAGHGEQTRFIREHYLRRAELALLVFVFCLGGLVLV